MRRMRGPRIGDWSPRPGLESRGLTEDSGTIRFLTRALSNRRRKESKPRHSYFVNPRIKLWAKKYNVREGDYVGFKKDENLFNQLMQKYFSVLELKYLNYQDK